MDNGTTKMGSHGQMKTIAVEEGGARPCAAAGSVETAGGVRPCSGSRWQPCFGVTGAAMGSLEAAWAKSAVADMAPPPMIASALSPARTAFPPGAQPPLPPIKGPVSMGTVPHMQTLTVMQG